MASSADVMVRFLADTSQVEKGVGKMSGAMQGFGKSVTSFIGGVAIGAFAKDAIGAANDMAESVSKMNTVFGKSSGEIRKFTENSAESLGISRQAATDAAGAYGNMFTQLGFTTKGAADMSKGMLTLTADLASFHNADPTAVIEAQSAAFRGEYDAIQKYIPTINAAAVEQRALADTGKASADQLTAGDKAAAAYALMIEGAGKATGDFARTSESASNQQRIMNAKLDDASVSIGQALQPALAVVVPWIAAAATAFAEAAPKIQTAAVALAGFAVAAYLVGGPIGALILGLGELVVMGYFVWTEWDKIWNWIKDHPAYAAIIAVLNLPIVALLSIVHAVQEAWRAWSDAWNDIKQATIDAWNVINGVWNTLKGAVGTIPTAISAAFSGLTAILTNPFTAAIGIIEGIFGTIKGIVSGAVGAIKSIWNPIANTLNGISIDIPSVSLPFGLGEVGGGTIDFPNVPKLASGGIVHSPTLALIGESGPEAVVPLSRGLGVTNVYTITVNVAPGSPPAEVGAAVVDSIRAYERVAGRAWRAS